MKPSVRRKLLTRVYQNLVDLCCVMHVAARFGTKAVLSARCANYCSTASHVSRLSCKSNV